MWVITCPNKTIFKNYVFATIENVIDYLIGDCFIDSEIHLIIRKVKDRRLYLVSVWHASLKANLGCLNQSGLGPEVNTQFNVIWLDTH